MSDIAIKVENLSKRYRIGLEEELPDTLVGALTQAVKRPLRNWRRLRRLTHFDDERPTTNDQPTPSDSESSSFVLRRSSGSEASPIDTLWALRDVSFEVQRGEVVGIIGRNGAGKSTLLKILARITHPTSGRAVINGRVGSLLEVGTGFHPELTGRENIYLNGTILGMTKAEVARKFDEIVAFSGVEKFIDTPVKRYSSGMRVRLAFSVAAHLDPEILLVDEVLAVGDVEFQEKCLGKMGDIAHEGRTVLFVSHNMGAISRLCHRGILLNSGKMTVDSRASKTIALYLNRLESDSKKHLKEREDRKGEGKVKIESVEVSNEETGSSDILATGCTARFRVRFSGEAAKMSSVFTIYDSLGHHVLILDSLEDGSQDCYNTLSKSEFICWIEELPLRPGRYRVNALIKGNGSVQDHIEAALFFDVVDGEIQGRVFGRRDAISIATRHRWILPSR